MDSTLVRVHQHGTGARQKKGRKQLEIPGEG